MSDNKILIVSAFLVVSACGEKSDNNGVVPSRTSEHSSEVVQLESLPKPKTADIQNNIYRHLTAVRTTNSDKQILGLACVNQLDFRNEMPTNKVLQGRQIEIPIDANITNPTVNVTRSRTVQTQPPPSNGMIFKPQVETVYYTSRETLPGTFRVIGSCIGSEYITE
jgi:hypothetical protein